MVRPPTVPLAVLLVLPALAAPADAQSVAPTLVGLVAGYGLESWKDEAAVPAQSLPGLPVGVPLPSQLGVYDNPYADPARPHQGDKAWLGYNLTATVELRDAQGTPVSGAGYYIGASVATAEGSVPAKLARLSASRFTAQFDLDGEDGAAFPALGVGAARIVVEVYQSTGDPTVVASRLASAEFPLEGLAAGLDRGGFLLREDALPGYADVGPGNLTVVQADLAAPGAPLVLTASLGAPDSPAEVVAWHRDARVVVAQGTTDALGRLAASFEPGEATANRSGLVILEAHLDGSRGRVASAVLAVPVSTHGTRVARYEFQGRQVAGQALDAAATLVVHVEDPTAAGERAVGGTLYLLDSGGQDLGTAMFDAASFAPTQAERTATLTSSQLPRASTYRLVGVLTTEDGRLYSLHQAWRGFSLGGGSAQAEPFRRASLPVLLRNFNNNFDDQRDAGMALPVHVRVAGLPGGSGFEGDLSVEESGEQRLLVPFSGDAGSYPVVINATSGELAASLEGEVRVARAQGGLLGLPGFEPLALLAAGLLAGLAQRSRARR
jgi:hypothetical protein